MKSKWLANILLTLGVTLILYTAGSQAYYAYIQYAMFKDMEAAVIEASSLLPRTGLKSPDNLPMAEPRRVSEEAAHLSGSVIPEPGTNFAPSTEHSTNETVPVQQQEKVEKPVFISLGTMEIPKIDVKMVVIEGTEPAKLAVGIAHVTGTALPGETGNCSVAGHRSGSAAKPFENLDKLESGDVIRFKIGDNAFEYEVFDSFVVEPTDVSVLKQDKEESIATIITCEYVSIGVKKRLIVQARLIEP